MLVFSTHAFTEGDVLSSFFGWLYAISTHAFTEGDRFYLDYFIACIISTHAFTEGDISSIPANSSSSSFQLTPSRKATFFWRLEFWHVIISTHAFTEGDPSRREEQPFQNYFNSRLHGRRPDQHPERDYAENHFNSRLHGRRPHSCC